MVYTISDRVDDASVPPPQSSPLPQQPQQQQQQVMDTKYQLANQNPECGGGGGSSGEGAACPYKPEETWRIWKNVLVLGFAFMVHFTAFWGASNLQSSVNSEQALGTFTLAAIYGSLILSNIFLPVIVIRWLGCKWTVALSFIAYMPFIASQFYPRFFTMIPAGLMVGLGGGPLWCAKCTYLSVVAEAYSQISGIASDVLVTRFFGVFFMFFQFSQVWGNLISSAVLSSGTEAIAVEDVKNLTLKNITSIITSSIDVSEVCGANFYHGAAAAEDNPNLVKPSAAKINLISAIYLACMIAAVLIVAFGVDSMRRYNNGRKGSGSGLSGLKLLAVTVKHIANPYQILIIPITMFIGAEQAFVFADYTASYVSCAWGINNIGYVMICFGVSNAIAALLAGSFGKLVGRNPVIVFGLVLHVALILTLLVWKPHPDNKIIFFAVASVWGLADAVWLVQINALSGILFPGKEEASYSNFRLWEATGSVVTYAVSPYLVTRVKLYLLLCLLLIGIIGYTVVEYKESRRKAKKSALQNQNITSKATEFSLIRSNGKSGEVAE